MPSTNNKYRIIIPPIRLKRFISRKVVITIKDEQGSSHTQTYNLNIDRNIFEFEIPIGVPYIYRNRNMNAMTFDVKVIDEDKNGRVCDETKPVPEYLSC